MGLWLYEAFALAMIYYFGVTYCLSKCTVDLMRFCAVVGSTFIVLARIGHQMQRVSQLRTSENP